MRAPLIRAAGGLYSLAWNLARPLLRRNRRLADGFAERLVPPDWAAPSAGGTDIWIQAASGGEARLACALLAALSARGEGAPLSVLLTTWTRQGRDILESGIARLPAGSPVRARARFVPFDDPLLMRRALAQSLPRLVVLLETELWPGLLLACREANVPLVLVNGRLRERTLRNYLWCAPLWRALAPARITAIAAADAARFRRLFPATPCTVINNIKFDQALPAALATPEDQGVPIPDLAPSLRALLTDAARRPLVLFASVREEEEDLLRPVLRELFSPGRPPARLIVAPRHMHRTDAWGNLLDAEGLAWRRRSTFGCRPDARPDSGLDAGPDVVVWDAFGELPWLYQVADAVFVGGSLAPLGGQNFLEALAAGVAPLTGPHLTNFAWALDDGGLEASGLLRVAPDAARAAACLCAAVARGPLTVAERAATRARFASWLAPRQGGTAAQAAVIADMLPPPDPCVRPGKCGRP